MKKKQYIKINNLSVSLDLFNFVKHDLLPKTKINIKDFWSGFSKSIYELTPINKKLISTRQKIQKKIDKWHKDNKGKLLRVIISNNTTS